jgi:hypothetical protein
MIPPTFFPASILVFATSTGTFTIEPATPPAHPARYVRTTTCYNKMVKQTALANTRSSAVVGATYKVISRNVFLP